MFISNKKFRLAVGRIGVVNSVCQGCTPFNIIGFGDCVNNKTLKKNVPSTVKKLTRYVVRSFIEKTVIFFVYKKVFLNFSIFVVFNIFKNVMTLFESVN